MAFIWTIWVIHCGKYLCYCFYIIYPNSKYLFSGLFIIDHRGVLRQITMNDLPVGRSVDETLRLVQAFQYTDSHGEVCPAGWKPGADTVSCYFVILARLIIEFICLSLQIVPNPEAKMKYFARNN